MLHSQTKLSNLLSVAGNFACLVGAMLLAVQMRLTLPGGSTPYQAQSPALYIALGIVVLAISIINLVSKEQAPFDLLFSDKRPELRFILTALVSMLVINFALPNIDLRHLLYFLLSSCIICFLAIYLPRRIYTKEPVGDFGRDITKLKHSRALLWLWVSYNIRSRYSQTILGILWIILLPLMTSLILTVAFTQFLRIQLDVPMVSFFLAGLIPFNLFNMGLLNGTRAISGKIELVTQVYFPREILVLIVLGEGLVDFIFTFCAMLLINLFFGIVPNIYYLYLPLVLLPLIALTLGAMLIVSSLSLLVRDIPQLIAVFSQLLFYVTPIIYPIKTIPEHLQFIFVLNPLAAIVQAFRDIIVYSRPPDMLTLYYPIVVGVMLLYLGYSVFKSVEGNMADMI
jgi:ABC-type polysaccharide/polyol phosphate export permease